MPYTPELNFEWEIPAQVIVVYTGSRFLAMADLGLNVLRRIVVEVEGIDVEQEDLSAKKEAQRLLKDGSVTLLVKSFDGETAFCEVQYGPFHEPRSDEGSFATAMIASGYANPA